MLLREGRQAWLFRCSSWTPPRLPPGTSIPVAAPVSHRVPYLTNRTAAPHFNYRTHRQRYNSPHPIQNQSANSTHDANCRTTLNTAAPTSPPTTRTPQTHGRDPLSTSLTFASRPARDQSIAPTTTWLSRLKRRAFLVLTPPMAMLSSSAARLLGSSSQASMPPILCLHR